MMIRTIVKSKLEDKSPVVFSIFDPLTLMIVSSLYLHLSDILSWDQLRAGGAISPPQRTSCRAWEQWQWEQH